MTFTTLSSHFGYLSHQLSRQSSDLSNTYQKLASGEAMQRARDDVASLSIATRLSTRLSGMRVAQSNLAQASSLLQVADGGLREINEILQRMSALSVQSNSAGLTNKERAFLNIEFQNLLEEADRIAQETQFNTIRVLDGTGRGREQEPFVVDETSELIGSVNPDTLEGGAGKDHITGFDGDDEILAGAGDDTIEAGFIQNPGLRGSIYQSGPFGGISGLAESENIVASQPVFATFISTQLDYPNGAQNTQNGTIGNLLGSDAASLDNPAAATTNANRTVYVWEGNITIETSGNYQFSVGSDDGFNLQIDGNTVIQFPNNRGFNFTTGNVNLSAGLQSFRLIFWENGGSEGVEALSTVSGVNAILDDSVLSYSENLTDGNDVIDGGEGSDTVVFTGNFADYGINFNNPTEIEVTDNRTNSPDGTDTIRNVELFQFADRTVSLAELASSEGVSLPVEEEGILRFQIDTSSAQQLVYEVVDATIDELFTTPDTLTILTQDAAREAFGAVQQAIKGVTERRAYVGSLMQQADYAHRALSSGLQHQHAAFGRIHDTDMARTSTTLATQLVQKNASIAVGAQTNQLHRETVLGIVDRAIQIDVLSQGGRA